MISDSDYELVGEIFTKLTAKTSKLADMQAAADSLCTLLVPLGILAIDQLQILDNISAAANYMTSHHARQGAMVAIRSIAETVGKQTEPYLIPLLTMVLDRAADKNQLVRSAADDAAVSIVSLVSPHSFHLVIPIIYQGMDSKKKWQTQRSAVSLFKHFMPRCNNQINKLLPQIVPHIANCIREIREEVNVTASETLLVLCSVIGNPDVDDVLTDVISCIGDPTKVPSAVERVADTTFVKSVRAPLLSVMMPLLGRGLAERANIVKRRCSVIVDNMCKLVPEASEILPFLPEVLPGLHRIVDVGGDPELVAVTARAIITLHRVSGLDVPEHLIEAADYDASRPMISGLTHAITKRDIELMEKNNARLDVIKKRQDKRDEEVDQLVSELPPTDDDEKKTIPQSQIYKLLLEEIKKVSPDVDVANAFIAQSIHYASTNCQALLLNKIFDGELWEDEYISPFLSGVIGGHPYAKSVTSHLLTRCRQILGITVDESESDIDFDLLTNCEFSLGYGAMVLLRKARLRLKKGQRYGICGANGCGKSTLLKAIANGQVDGFPPQSEVKTFMVADELMGSDSSTSILELLFNDERFKGTSKEKIANTLSFLGFTKSVQDQGVGSLSGGWKMKLSLARAILMDADLLLLDEPTNHLDVDNVKWLVEYLNSLKTVTSLVISHDTKFLDNVCTGIIHYESKKLKIYKGNLSEFVKLKPEAKAYYTLEDAQTTFVFPKPGLLDGVNSRVKPVLRLKNISFTYPNVNAPALHNVSASCCLSSRIAIIGANGAGKSTMVKVLTGEMMAQQGEVWKHPTLRVTYVAQHPLKYLNMHLDKTPNQYLQWRFEKGEDKELIMKQSRQLSKEEEEQMEKLIEGKNGQKRKVDQVVGRAKLKKSFQYEIKWVGLNEKFNSWIPRERLDEWGFSKLIQAFDDKMAGSIQRHFEDFGLEPQFSTHGKIGNLSGGQKIKTILAAAMWGNPHMLILDEPTNYLDRESLAAFADAIKSFEGGVVIISHNHEFTAALCTERWYMDGGVLTLEGKQAAVDDEEDESSDVTPANGGGGGEVSSSDAELIHIDGEEKGPIGGGKVVSEKGKKLSRKQLKELEYKKKRDELIRLGIVPE